MIFVLPRLSARENMELDSRLPSEGPGSFRVYGWSSVAVTLGFSQLCEVALVSPLPEGIEVASRPTGGRAVLHGHDVTVGVCVSLHRLGLPDGSRSLRAAYRQIVAPIVDALNEVGVPAALGEDTRFARLVGGSPDCFAHVSANDVVHAGSGAKLCERVSRFGDHRSIRGKSCVKRANRTGSTWMKTNWLRICVSNFPHSFLKKLHYNRWHAMLLCPKIQPSARQAMVDARGPLRAA